MPAMSQVPLFQWMAASAWADNACYAAKLVGRTQVHNAPDVRSNTKMSDAENFERFQKVAVEVLSVEKDKVTKEAKFAEDLDADSLDLVEFVMELENEFDVNVEDDELEGVDTIGGAYDLVVGKLS